MLNIDEIFGGFEKEIEDKSKINNKVVEARELILDKFKKIEFVEEGHKYSVDDDEYTPVSNIIKLYEPEVDWDQKAADYAKKYGRKKEDVQKEWKLNNLKSTISGTRTHEFGESYTNLICGHPELICEQNKPQYIEEYNTMVSTYPKEDAVKKFYDELEKNLHPVGAEFKLSTQYMDCLKICGTCDLLFYDSDNDYYVIGDWKTNKSLIKEYARNNGVCMKYPLDKKIDEPLSHYTVQFNLYQRMLESIGLKIGDRVLVWLKDDGTYEKIYVEKIDDNIIDKIMRGER